MSSRDWTRDGLKLAGGNSTHGLLGLLNTCFNLLYTILQFILDDVDLMFPDDGNGCFGSELFRARPPHSPVPSHELGRVLGGGPRPKGPEIRIKRKPWSCRFA